jgi:cytochrome c-type biogenesis protein CcmF
MIVNVGFGSLAVAFVVALYSVGAALYGVRSKADAWIESARYAVISVFLLISLAVATLIVLMLTGHYEVAYVYEVINSGMPVYLKVTALWGGQEGSLLFWCWLMAGAAFIVMLRNWKEDRPLLPWVIAVTMVTLAFFLGMTIFSVDVFARLWTMPDGTEVTSIFQPAGAMAIYPYNGVGLNPLLRHPAMIIHPPALYLGFVLFIVPFAFAIAALITGQKDDRWIALTHRWTLTAWLFLSAGLLLGMWWAYGVLGWGGYWGWDPVEIAALMPWLSGTAFLHSAILLERRDLARRWTVFLIMLTYALVILGTFLTRSGLLSSVHAFAESDLGIPFFIFLSLALIGMFGLLVYRWNDLEGHGVLTSLLSRDSIFILNNLFIMGILAVCLWGVLFPIVSEWITGQRITVGPPFYEHAAGPLFAVLLLLMGIVPLMAWGRSTMKTLGAALWKPLVAALVLLVIAFALGVRQWAALLGIGLAALAGCVTLYDYGRSVWLRHKSRGETLLLSLWRTSGVSRRRYGGYIIHVGFSLMALGVIGIDMFQTQTQATLALGQSIQLDGYTLAYHKLNTTDTPDGRNLAQAVLDISYQGSSIGQLLPTRDYYYTIQQDVTLPAIRSTLKDDLYVVLADWQDISTQNATFKVYHNPLVAWLWIGGVVLVLGTLMAAWPSEEKRRRNKQVLP